MADNKGETDYIAKISVSMSEELVKKIDEMAAREKRSRSNMISILLKDELSKYKTISDKEPDV